MIAAIPFPDLSPDLFSFSAFGMEFALRWYALAYIIGILIAWRLSVAAVSRAELWSGTPPMSPLTPTTTPSESPNPTTTPSVQPRTGRRPTPNDAQWVLSPHAQSPQHPGQTRVKRTHQ